MKTYVYVKNGKIVANGRCDDNCDSVNAIGRPHNDDEIVGFGRNKQEALEDALITEYHNFMD